MLLIFTVERALYTCLLNFLRIVHLVNFKIYDFGIDQPLLAKVIDLHLYSLLLL